MRPLAGLALLVAAGCQQDAAIFLTVEAALRVPDECDGLRVEARRGPADGPVIFEQTWASPRAQFPLTLALTNSNPENLGEAGVTVTATALKDGELARPWARGSGWTTLEKGRTAQLVVTLCDCPDGGVITPGDAGVADVQFTVDSAAEVHPISRYIYGRQLGNGAWTAEPYLTLTRVGGSRWTTYNWENNASNAGSNSTFANDAALGGGLTAGEAVRAPVAAAQAAGGATLVGIPMAGWVSADKLGDVRGDPVATRFKQSVASKGAAFVYPPDTADGAVYQDEFVAWLEQQFPAAHDDPAREIFYALDHEPELWFDSHSEVHPAKVTYAELLARTLEYSKALKAAAPKAKVFGPASYGFNGYVSLQDAPDASGRDFLEFYLAGMKTAEAAAGRRLLDVLDLHWYPEAKGGGVRVTSEDTSAAVANARMQAPRSLWDPGYVETSWISAYLGGKAIALIPGLKAKIAAQYPGTALAFTQYYYGGGAHISGAIAQADVLGIFGREQVFAASLEAETVSLPFALAAFRMYRGFDGTAGAFGNTSVQATNSDTMGASVYASVDEGAPGRLTLVAINKASAPKTAAVTIHHTVAFARAQVYQLTSASPAPVRAADVVLGQVNAFQVTMPPLSVSTLVLTP
jgi:hypothetical protein